MLMMTAGPIWQQQQNVRQSPRLESVPELTWAVKVGHFVWSASQFRVAAHAAAVSP